MNQYYIKRSHNGVSACAIPGKDLSREIYSTFSYAVCNYSFLIQLNETINGNEWIKRIKEYYSDSKRTEAVVLAIKAAMPI